MTVFPFFRRFTVSTSIEPMSVYKAHSSALHRNVLSQSTSDESGFRGSGTWGLFELFKIIQVAQLQIKPVLTTTKAAFSLSIIAAHKPQKNIQVTDFYCFAFP